MNYKKLLVAFVLFSIYSISGYGQVTIASDGLNNSSSLFTLSGGTYYTGNSAGIGVDLPPNSPFAVEGTHSYGISSGTATLTTTSSIDVSTYTGISTTFRLASFSIGSTGNGADAIAAGDIVTVSVSPDGGTTYYSTLRVGGNSNAVWTYAGGTGIASTAYDGNVTPVDIAPGGGGTRTTDGYSTVTITGLPATTTLKIRITLVNNSAAERWLVDDFKVQGTLSTPAVTLANNGTQITTANVPQGTTSHILSSFQCTVANAATTLTQATFLALGTYQAADLNTDFTLWYKSTNVFATATPIANITSTSTGSGDFLSFTGLTQALPVGTNYFWITTNISSTATLARNISIDTVANADLVFGSGTKSGSASSGGLQTITPLTKVTISNGDWANGAIWSPAGVPTSGQNVTVNHIVTSVAAITRDSGTTTTISAASSLAVSATYTNNGATTVTGTFQLNGGGYADGLNSFVYGANGTLIFNAAYTANSGTYWPAASGPFNVTVTSSGALTIGFSRTVGGVFQTASGISFGGFSLNLNGTCQLNGGGFFNHTPIYGGASTLIYNNGGTFGQTAEWTANGTTAGTGIPQNVTIQNSTVLNMANSNRGMAGNLNITSGNLVLDSGSGDLYLAGNWTRASTATFTPSGRAVFFNGSTTQSVTVSASGTETFNYLLVQGSGTLKLTTGTNVVVNSSNGLTLGSSNATSTIDLNGQTLTLSGGGNLSLAGGTRKITSTIASGSFSITSNLVTITNGGTLSTDANTIVKLQNGFDSGAGSLLTVNGTLQINSLGYCSGNSPRYGAASLLQYNTTGSFSRTLEWTSNTAAIGTAGYPNNVQISNNTTLNYYNASNTGAKGMNGNFVIDSGSSIAFGGITTAGALSVAGNVTNAGTITLGVAVGDDLKLAGNYANTGTGTFNGNDRAIWFTKAGTQTVATGSSPLTIPYVVTSGGGTTVQLLCNVVISAPLAGYAIDFGNGADVIDMNAFSVTIGTANVANVINGSGSFKGNAASNLTLLGTGSLGTLKFVTDFNLGTFTTNRTLSGMVVMGSVVTVNTSLVLTSGLIDLVNYTMTLGSAVTPGLAGSASSYVIADVSTGGAGGILSRAIPANGAYIFPIGDKSASTDGSQYTPATITFSGAASYTAAFLGVAVNDVIKHPNMDATTNYLSRYWALTTLGTFTSPTYSFVGTYITSPTDITGALTSGFKSNQWNGTAWTNIGSTVTVGTTITVSNCTTLPAVNHFSAGERDKEINIVQGATNYLTGSTYDFGNITIGFPLDITFNIQNLGNQLLTLGSGVGGSPVITGNPPFSLLTSYSGPPYTVPQMTGTTVNSSTIVVRCNPVATGPFTGSITIKSDDADEGAGYVINFTCVGIAAVPEINIQGLGINIAPGNTPAFADNTLFSAQNIGSTSTTNNFVIQNLGSGTLTLSGISPYVTLGGANPGDFSVFTIPSNSIAYSSSTTLGIRFTPLASGTRNATVTVYSNDSDEGTYTFNISGVGNCVAVTIASVTPASGPVASHITITSSSGSLLGTTVAFNSVSATILSSSATQLVVVVPATATSGNIVITNTTTNCVTNVPFTVTKVTGTCSGLSELIMTEIYDSPSGTLGYLEIYNGTGAAVDLTTYFVRRFGDNAALLANTYTDYSFSPSITTIPTGQVRYGRISTAANTASPNFDYSPLAGGINGSDIFHLYHGSTIVDVYVVPNATDGYTAKRNVNTSGPNTSSNPSDWSHTNTATIADLGTFAYNPPASTIPTTTNPADVSTCNSKASFTVTGTLAPGPGALTYQWYYNSGVTATWTAVAANSFTGVVATNFMTNTLTLSGAIGSYNGYQFYCNVIQNGTCGTASNAAQLGVTASVWNGTTWIGGTPSLTIGAVIDGTYDTAVNGNFQACSVTVNPSKTLTIKTGNYVTIQNDLFVNSTGTFVVENNGSLIMIDDAGVVTNNGTTQVKRTATGVRGFDYVYWSSPVIGQSIDTFYSSPTPGYKYKWNPLATNINSPTSSGTWQLMSGSMSPGSGYIVRGSSSYGMAASSIPGVFSGAVNNGVISPTISRGTYTGVNYTGLSNATVTKLDDNWNLIGNPYPSSIKALDFLSYNSNIQGFVYLWTHGTAPISITNPFYNSFAYNYTSNDYITYNGTATTNGPTGFGGFIGAGQGFFVVMNDGATATQVVNFKNSMRHDVSFSGYANTQFYKNQQPDSVEGDKSRIWLDLLDANNQPVRTVVGYVPEATTGLDRLYDAYKNTENEMNIYSLAETQTLIIQGRPLPFDVNDQVPVGVRIMQDGAYKIAIGAVDGIFEGDQTIYLEDKVLGIIYDLRQSPYSFNATAGIINDRFVLRYINSALGNPDFGNLDSSVVVSTNHGEMSIKSYLEPIQDVIVYDILGRQLFEAKNISNNNFATSNISMSQQALIVKIKLSNGVVVTRKIVL